MNPFVNPKKRSISLPSRCKDLADVLKRQDSKHEDTTRRFIHLLLLHAQQAEATELAIGSPSTTGYTPITYKDGDNWFGLPALPNNQRPAIIAELARMAGLP